VVSSRLLERSSLLGAVQARNEHYMVTALRGASGYTTIIEIPEGTNPRMSDIARQGALQISIRRKVTFTAKTIKSGSISFREGFTFGVAR
jgi:hypothetical protein